MLYKKEGVPEVEEIILCQVTKIYPNSVFVDLLEFKDKYGVIYISEVAPGRIRNLRDFVALGRQVVCKVLRVDSYSGNIDLSLRRVNSSQRKEKLDEIKQELKAENLIKSVAKQLKQPVESLYQQISKKIFGEYSHLFLCFKAVSEKETDLEKLGLEKNVVQLLTQAITEKFKPVKVVLTGEISLATYAPNGLEKIKGTLLELGKVSPSAVITYLGGGKYKLTIKEDDYPSLEKDSQNVEQILEKFKDKHSTASFEREKKE